MKDFKVKLNWNQSIVSPGEDETPNLRVNLIDERSDEPERGTADVTESRDVQNGGLESDSFHLDDVVQRHVEGRPRPMKQLQQRVEALGRHRTSEVRLQHRDRLKAKS